MQGGSWAYPQGCSPPDTEVSFAFESKQIHDPQPSDSDAVLLAYFRRTSYSARRTPETK
jgi:hypothetical protein